MEIWWVLWFTGNALYSCFFPNSVFMIFFYFILFFHSFFFFFSFLPDHILQRRYTYLRFTGQNRNGSYFHNTSQRTVWFFPGACAPAALGRGCRQPGRWLPFGLRYPSHSGKNALTPCQRLCWGWSVFPIIGGGDSLVLLPSLPTLAEHLKFSDGVSPGGKQ